MQTFPYLLKCPLLATKCVTGSGRVCNSRGSESVTNPLFYVAKWKFYADAVLSEVANLKTMWSSMFDRGSLLLYFFHAGTGQNDWNKRPDFRSITIKCLKTSRLRVHKMVRTIYNGWEANEVERFTGLPGYMCSSVEWLLWDFGPKLCSWNSCSRTSCSREIF